MLHALAEIAPDCFNLSARSVVLPIVPMFHANAWGMPWAAPLTGLQAGAVAPTIGPSNCATCFATRSVTHSAGVPTVWLGMIEHIERTGDEPRPICRHVTIGGSAAPRAMIEWFRERGIQVGHAWGMTETSPIGTMGAPPARLGGDERRGAGRLSSAARAGSPFGVELRIVDEDGEVLPRDGEAVGQSAGPRTVGRSGAISRRTNDAATATIGSTPATSPRSTPTGRCRSPTAPRT